MFGEGRDLMNRLVVYPLCRLVDSLPLSICDNRSLFVHGSAVRGQPRIPRIRTLSRTGSELRGPPLGLAVPVLGWPDILCPGALALRRSVHVRKGNQNWAGSADSRSAAGAFL